MLCLGSTDEGHWSGLSFSRLTPGVSSWALSASSWQNTLFRFDVDVLTSIGTKASWSTGTGPWLSGCLGTNTPKRYASGSEVNRVGGSAAWTAKWTGWLAKSSLTPSKPRPWRKSLSVVPDRPVGLKEQKLPPGVGVCYLYQPGELEGGRRRATNPVWSLEVSGEPVVYYLENGPQRDFVREELLVVPPDTQLPPDGVLRCWAQLLLFFGCTRDRSAWCYRGCGPRCCLSGQRWTAGCPSAERPVRCCTRRSYCPGPPSVLGCDQPSG